MSSRLASLPDDIQTLIWRFSFVVVMEEMRNREKYNRVVRQLKRHTGVVFRMYLSRHTYPQDRLDP